MKYKVVRFEAEGVEGGFYHQFVKDSDRQVKYSSPLSTAGDRSKMYLTKMRSAISIVNLVLMREKSCFFQY